MLKNLLRRPFFIRLLNWEYWPFHVVYAPVYLYWLWLCIRSRSFFFFNTANPTITNGGFLMESKWDIYQLLPVNSYPSTVFLEAGADGQTLIETVRQKGLKYPLVGKPDIGMKGLSVKKLDNEDDLIAYGKRSKVNFLVQEFVHFEKEAGIFYYRLPLEQKGHISGIVGKEFLKVIGDGNSTIEDLLRKEKRYILQLNTLRKTYGSRLNEVLSLNEEFVLVPYGNHVRGSKFIDISHLIDNELTEAIDAICSKVNGFYYGRLDIRYNSWEELRRGDNFSIIELNGAGSEPTHIYDPRHSIFFAWREITRHLKLLWIISRRNYHHTRQPYMKLRQGLDMLKKNKAYVKLIS